MTRLRLSVPTLVHPTLPVDRPGPGEADMSVQSVLVTILLILLVVFLATKVL